MMHLNLESHSALRLAMAGALLCTESCFSHDVKIEPIEVKPIHLTMDVNLRIQRELDEFFDFEGKPATRPAKDEASPAQETVR